LYLIICKWQWQLLVKIGVQCADSATKILFKYNLGTNNAEINGDQNCKKICQNILEKGLKSQTFGNFANFACIELNNWEI
jgi:hypothetical protein